MALKPIPITADGSGPEGAIPVEIYGVGGEGPDLSDYALKSEIPSEPGDINAQPAGDYAPTSHTHAIEDVLVAEGRSLAEALDIFDSRISVVEDALEVGNPE